jgi:hypothetical protein
LKRGTYVNIIQDIITDKKEYNIPIKIITVSLRDFDQKSFVKQLEKFENVQIILASPTGALWPGHPNQDKAVQSIENFISAAKVDKKIAVFTVDAPIFFSVFLVGDLMVVIHHICGKSSIDSPITILHKNDRLYDEFATTFDAVEKIKLSCF